MEASEIMARLEAAANAKDREGMAHYGIRGANVYGGTSMPAMRKIAREAGKDHALAEQLWESGVHEARLIACMVEDPKQVTEEQVEAWVAGIDSWDLCDGCCGNLFDRLPFAYRKAAEWARRDEEYVRRAGFALVTQLTVHDKGAPDEAFLAFLPLVIEASGDDRNFVKKAVNWALRQIGKRSRALNEAAIAAAREIRAAGTRSGRWIAADALKELESDAVKERLAKRELGTASPDA